MPDTTADIGVALVDDDPHYRALFSTAIAQTPGLRMLCAAVCGQDMLLWLHLHRPDVLLVDLGLPDVSGIEVVQQAVRRWPGLSIAVVTLFSDEPRVMACLEAGASGYLLKQSPTLAIGPMVHELHAGGAPMSPGIAAYLLQRMRTADAPASASVPANDASEVTLTERERVILQQIARGFRVIEIADHLGVRCSTVSSHLKNIYSKLSVHSKTEAVFEAQQMRLIPPVA